MSFWAGQKDTNICGLCGEARETAAHTVWTCKALYDERCKFDKTLAGCNGEKNLPPAMQHHIAPAMSADAEGMFYGGEVPKDWDKGVQKMFGKGVGKISHGVKRILKQFESTATQEKCFNLQRGLPLRRHTRCQKNVKRQALSK